MLVAACVRVRVRAHRPRVCASAPPVCTAGVWVFQGCGSCRGLRQVSSQQTEESDSNPGESQNRGFWGGYEQAIQPNNVHAQCIRSALVLRAECVRSAFGVLWRAAQGLLRL